MTEKSTTTSQAVRVFGHAWLDSIVRHIPIPSLADLVVNYACRELKLQLDGPTVIYPLYNFAPEFVHNTFTDKQPPPHAFIHTALASAALFARAPDSESLCSWSTACMPLLPRHESMPFGHNGNLTCRVWMDPTRLPSIVQAAPRYTYAMTNVQYVWRLFGGSLLFQIRRPTLHSQVHAVLIDASSGRIYRFRLFPGSSSSLVVCNSGHTFAYVDHQEKLFIRRVHATTQVSDDDICQYSWMSPAARSCPVIRGPFAVPYYTVSGWRQSSLRLVSIDDEQTLTWTSQARTRGYIWHSLKSATINDATEVDWLTEYINRQWTDEKDAFRVAYDHQEEMFLLSYSYRIANGSHMGLTNDEPAAFSSASSTPTESKNATRRFRDIRHGATDIAVRLTNSSSLIVRYF